MGSEHDGAAESPSEQCGDLAQQNAALRSALSQALVREEFFRLIAEHVGDFVAVLDLEGRRVYNSRSYARLFGNPSQLVGTDSFAEIHPDDVEAVQEAFRETVRTGRGHMLTFRFLLPDRSVHYMESSGALVCDTAGKPCHVVVVSRDITERVADEQRIRELAYHDALTQLPNRRLLEDRIDQAMAASERSGHYGALLLLDLDHFKELNDEYGHAMGDELLIQTARRALGSVRKTDTVARLGGDEFVVLLGSLDADEEASGVQAGLLAEKLRARLAKPYRLKVHNGDGEVMPELIEHRCTVSIGCTLFMGHEISIDDLMQRADRAMYAAKQAGANQVCVAD